MSKIQLTKRLIANGLAHFRSRAVSRGEYKAVFSALWNGRVWSEDTETYNKISLWHKTFFQGFLTMTWLALENSKKKQRINGPSHDG